MIARFNQVLTVVDKYVADYLSAAVRHYAALPDMPERIVPEGDGVITVTENGQESIVELRKMEGSASLPLENFKNPDPEKIYGLLQDVAWQIAQQQQKLLIDKVGGAAEGAGNSMQHKGPLTAEHIFAMYKKITLDFYSNGEPHELTMFSGPEMTAEYDRLMKYIPEDPILNKRFTEIIDLKRKEFNARESNRKLVG